MQCKMAAVSSEQFCFEHCPQSEEHCPQSEEPCPQSEEHCPQSEEPLSNFSFSLELLKFWSHIFHVCMCMYVNFYLKAKRKIKTKKKRR